MGFGRYAKGARGERELINRFSENGFSVIRAAGSGVNTLSPDLLSFRKGKQYAFECKAWSATSVGIEVEKFEGLKKWEENTGITTFIAWRINRLGWFFMYLDELEKQKKNYTITQKRAEAINRRFEDICGAV
ncbi:MAG: Holliday junction resolvase Hjc [Candidatus Micrarchaeota archaeon]